MIQLANRTLSITTASLLALSFTAVPAISQESRAPEQRREQPQDPAKPQDSAKPQAKAAIRILSQGEVVGAAVTNGKQEDELVTLGSIADLVFDSYTGQVRYAIIASGGTLGLGKTMTAVAFHHLACDADSGFTMAMTAKQLEEMPKYDPSKLDLLGKQTAAEAAADADAHSGKGTGNGSGAGNANGVGNGSGAATKGEAVKPEAAASKDAVLPRTTWMLASQVADCPMMASKDELGAGATIMVEPNRGQVVFFNVPVGGLAGIGDSNYIVPWHAVTFLAPTGDAKHHQLQLPKSKLELQAAPKLEDEGANVDTAAFRQEVYKFFGLERPAFEAKTDAKDAQAGERLRRS